MASGWTGYADGGSRGNPGPAGFGWVLLKDGVQIDEGKGFLGKTTNNVAEWEGLIALLSAAKKWKAENPEIRADSELVIRQCTGQYKVKQPHLKPLHEKAMTLAAGLGKVRFVHVRREENKEADRLANEAMDQAKR